MKFIRNPYCHIQAYKIISQIAQNELASTLSNSHKQGKYFATKIVNKLKKHFRISSPVSSNIL